MINDYMIYMAYFMTSFSFAELFLLTKCDFAAGNQPLLEADGPGPRVCQDAEFFPKGWVGIRPSPGRRRRRKKKSTCASNYYINYIMIYYVL